MQSISEWLQSLGLDQYAQVFEDNCIDLEVVPSLSEQDLEKLGMPMGHCKKLLKAIAKLNDVKPAASSSSEASRRLTTGTAERRHLTVMFCDLVGSTQLSQNLDPEALRELMHEYQRTCGRVIENFDGHVAQYLGDGLMTYFGWPRAHEDDAERAIRASLEIVDAVNQLQAPESLHVRIGIATGLVVVGETGSGDASVPKLAVGETPNLAARIQGLAQADQIIIGADTRRLVGGVFDVTDFGEHALKGIVEKVRAWRVKGLSAAEGRFEAAHVASRLTPLVGRKEEIGILLRRWQLAQDGDGQVVLLSGEPGIGKSRIMNTLRERLEGSGAQSLRFQCSPYYVNSAFWPLSDNFERVFKFSRDETDESKLDKLEALMVEHYGRPLSDVRFIAAMLSIPCDARYGELAMTPQKFKDETLRTLVDLTEAAASKQPTVVLLEDAHWADPTTLEVLDLMVDRISAISTLIVMTHRPEFQNRWVDHGHVTGLNLSKLTRAQSTSMVDRVTAGKALPAELLDQILAKTDGVPLYVEELTKSILESGELIDTGESYAYASKAQNVTIPATLRDSLMARLDRYTLVKEIAQIGAAIGREFSYELISAVAPLSTDQLDDSLGQLTESGLAFRRGTPPEAIYTFKHALVQEAAYDSLLKSRRQKFHGKIAREIEACFPQTKVAEPEVLAHHLSAAGQTEAAIPLWQKAGEIAWNRAALVEAISHLDQGLELVTSLPPSRERDARELALRIPLGTIWTALKGWPAQEVWNNGHPALALAKSLERYDAQIYISGSLMACIQTRGLAAEALTWAEEIFDVAQSTGDADLLITGHTSLCSGYFWAGRIVEALGHGKQIMQLYEKQENRQPFGLTGFDRRTTAGLCSAISTWMLGYPDRAVQLSDEKDALARRLGYPFDLGWALSDGARVFDFRCEPKELRKRVEECERVGRENNMPVLWASQAPVYYGIAFVREAKPAEAIAPIQAGLKVWGESGGKLDTPYFTSVLAEAMALTGKVDEGLQLIDEQIEQIERPGWEERLHYAEILRLKGWMLALKNDNCGAEQAYFASLEWSREQKSKSWELRTSTSLARLWQDQGKRKEAVELLAPVYNWFTEGFDTKDLKEARTLLDELES